MNDLKNQALLLRSQGKTYKSIATQLNVSESTARRYFISGKQKTKKEYTNEELASLVRACRKNKATESQMASFEKFMTISLLDGTSYTFDCFYSRLFFFCWELGYRPSYSVFVLAMEGFIESGYVTDGDIGYLFDNRRNPARFVELLTRRDDDWNPTAEKMDKSYRLFKGLAHKKLIEIKRESNPEVKKEDPPNYSKKFFPYFEEAGGKLTLAVYREIIDNERGHPSISWVKSCYEDYLKANPDVELTDAEKYALSLPSCNLSTWYKLDPLIGEVVVGLQRAYPCRAVDAYDAIRKLGIIGLCSDDITPIDYADNNMYVGSPGIYEFDPNKKFTTYRPKEGRVFHDFHVTVKDLLQDGETVRETVRLKNAYDTFNHVDFLRVLNEWNGTIEHLAVVKRNAALQMTHEEYCQYKYDLNRYCQELFSRFQYYVITSHKGTLDFDSWHELSRLFSHFGVTVEFESICDTVTQINYESYLKQSYFDRLRALPHNSVGFPFF